MTILRREDCRAASILKVHSPYSTNIILAALIPEPQKSENNCEIDYCAGFWSIVLLNLRSTISLIIIIRS